MRRRYVKPRSIVFAAVVSLLLGIATAVLWARSVGTFDRVTAERGRAVWTVATFPGGVSFHRSAGPSEREPRLAFASDPYHVDMPMGPGTGRYVPVRHTWRYAGFKVARQQFAPHPTVPGALLPRGANDLPGYVWHTVVVPFWFVVVTCFALPARWAAGALRRRSRRRRGACLWCGYDLRESPGRCPECGQASAAGAGA